MKTTFNQVEIVNELTGEPMAYAALEMKLNEDGSIDECDAAQSIYDIMCRDAEEVPAYLELVSQDIRWEALIVDDVVCTSDHVMDKHYVGSGGQTASKNSPNFSAREAFMGNGVEEALKPRPIVFDTSFVDTIISAANDRTLLGRYRWYCMYTSKRDQIIHAFGLGCAIGGVARLIKFIITGEF